jgi:pimeloyl-ACP methyl ester carboxylesterase
MRNICAAPSLGVACLLIALAGCAGSGNPGGQTSASKPKSVEGTASASAAGGIGSSGGRREITVTVQGRTIAGECNGKPVPGAPTIVLDSGQGNDRTQLQPIGEALLDRAMVCSYDRAGYGKSDPAATPRPITQVVEDLRTFLHHGNVPGPYFLIGQSQGGANAVLFSVLHPGEVAGFVAMNPGPPCALYLRTVAKVMSREELASEVAACKGQNGEGIDVRPQSQVLHASLPRSLPYAIMYAWTCAGDEFCHRVRPVERHDEAALADIGRGGHFVEVKGADHEIWVTHMGAVLRTVDQVWKQAVG